MVKPIFSLKIPQSCYYALTARSFGRIFVQRVSLALILTLESYGATFAIVGPFHHTSHYNDSLIRLVLSCC